jgi:hypothetical protein
MAQLPGREALEDVAWSVRTRWSEHRSYLTYSRYLHPLNVLNHSTQLVIEAFPRSANTFATVAFQISQPAPVRVAHHLHAPAQVIEAVRRQTPVLLLVRHPRDAVVSQVVRSPGISVRGALVAYERFHAHVLPVRAGCHVATFEQVTSDFGAVIRELNHRFGTDFGVFSHTDDAVAEVYRMIDDRAREPRLAGAVAAYRSGVLPRGELDMLVNGLAASSGREAVPPHRVARPIDQRRDLQDIVRRAYDAPQIRALRGHAEAAYRQITAANR